jgi:hypothetical protein
LIAIDEFNLTWLSFADSCWQRYENRADYNILTCVYKVTRARCEGFLQESPISPPFLPHCGIENALEKARKSIACVPHHQPDGQQRELRRNRAVSQMDVLIRSALVMQECSWS